MEPSIFTRIIKGEIPCHKIYEDESTLAFLDIHPAVPGHTLVVPKVQVDRLEDLSDKDYSSLMIVVKKVMKQQSKVYGDTIRPCIKTEGFDVPHAHVHVMPCASPADFWNKQRTDSEPNHSQLAVEAQKLAF